MISIDLASYKDLYLKTTREYISELKSNLNLLNMDTTNKELIYEVFRLLHSLKSQNYFMSFTKTADLFHIMEQYFRSIKDGINTYSTDFFPQISQSISKLENSVNNIEKNNVEIDLSAELEPLKQKLNVQLT